MKKLILLTGFMFLLLFAEAQENDTIKNSNQPNVQQIVIKLNIDLTNLQNGLKDFENKINDKQVEIKILNDSIKIIKNKAMNDTNQVSNNQIDSINTLIEINQDIVEALQNGIDDINSSIEDINDQLAEMQDKNFSIEREDKPDMPKKHANKFKGHWAGVSLGLNTFGGTNFSLNLPAVASYMELYLPKSWEVSVNPVQFSIPFFNKYVGAVSGIGFTFNNYELRNNNLTLFVDSLNAVNSTTETFTYTKNRLKTAYLTVPLLIEFQIPVNKKSKRLFLSAGAIGNYCLQTKMKYTYDFNNAKITYKDKTSNWPTTMFNYDLTVRLGYDDWYLYANYKMLPMFEANKGPQINNISAGLGLRF